MTVAEFLLARIAEDEADAERIVYDDGGMNFRPYDRRWLAECAAKRWIVEAHSWSCEVERETERAWAAWLTLAHLAAVFSDHPDYREEWTP